MLMPEGYQQSVQQQGGVDESQLKVVDPAKSDIDNVLQLEGREEASLHLSARLGQADDAMNRKVRPKLNYMAFESPWSQIGASYSEQLSSFLQYSESACLSPLLPLRRELEVGAFTSDLSANFWMEDELPKPHDVQFQDKNATNSFPSDAAGLNFQCRQHPAMSENGRQQFAGGLEGLDFEGGLLRLLSFPQQPNNSSAAFMSYPTCSALATAKLQQGSGVFQTTSDNKSLVIKGASGGAGSAAMIRTPNSSFSSSSASEDAVDHEEASHSRPGADDIDDADLVAGIFKLRPKSALKLPSDGNFSPATKAHDSKKDAKPPKKGKKRVREARYAIQTKSERDVLEDGYKWRKYGQKTVKNSPHPRSYYRCTFTKCSVKKTVERSCNDPSLVITTYEGVHIHPSPSSTHPCTDNNAVIQGGTTDDAAICVFPSMRSPGASVIISPHFLTDTSCSLRPLIPDHPRVSFHDVSVLQNIMKGARHHPQFDRGLLEDVVPPTIRNKC